MVLQFQVVEAEENQHISGLMQFIPCCSRGQLYKKKNPEVYTKGVSFMVCELYLKERYVDLKNRGF